MIHRDCVYYKNALAGDWCNYMNLPITEDDCRVCKKYDNGIKEGEK